MRLLRLQYAAGSGVGLAAKMLAILFFAWRFSPNAYALLVQVQAQASLWVLVAGLDLYVYFHRRWVQQAHAIPRDELAWFVVAIAASYAIVAPVVMALSSMDPTHTLLMLAVIVSEHLSQELNRVLLAFERHMLAMVVQLLRNFVWVLIFVAVSFAMPLRDPLTVFLALWSAGGAVAIVAGAFFLPRLTTVPSRERVASLFGSAGAVVVPSIVATFAARTMLSADRLVAAATLSIGEIAAYGMYVTIGAGALAITDICVIAFTQPRLLRLLKADADPADRLRGGASMHRALVQIVAVNTVVSACGWGFIVIALAPSFAASPVAFVIVQCAYLFYAMTHAADGVLYALGRFRTNLVTTIGAAALLGVLLLAVSGFELGILGLSLATALAFVSLLMMKLWAAERELRGRRTAA